MKKILLLLSILISLNNVFGQAGSPDLTYGVNGQSIQDGTGLNVRDIGKTFIYDSITEKTTICGFSFAAANDYRFSAVRLNSNGDLDSTFGTNGRAFFDVNATGSYDVCNNGALQSDGKLVLVGKTQGVGTNDDFAIIRLNVNGSLDNTFDSDGILEIPMAGNQEAFDVAIQNDGKIVVSGGGDNGGTGRDFLTMRLNSDGSFDNSFDGDGIRYEALSVYYEYTTKLFIQNDGKILAAGIGRVLSTTYNDVTVVRYNSDGSLDNNFDGDGMAHIVFDSTWHSIPTNLTVHNNKIWITGYRTNTSWNQYDHAVARLNSNGSLDNTFGTDGVLVESIGTAIDMANSVAFQDDGKYIIGGYAYFGSYSDVIMRRFNADGSIDNSFGTAGLVRGDFVSGTNHNEIGGFVSIQNDKKILLGGSGSVDGFDPDEFGVLRFNYCGPATSTDVVSAVCSYTWIDGNTYTASTNTPTFTYVGGASDGCDSIVTLNLTINSIADQSLSANDDTVSCVGDSTTITVSSSQLGLNYYLFNDGDSTLIDGPVAGTGSSITLNTYGVDSTTIYHVYAENRPNSNNALDFDGIDDEVNVNGINLANNSFTVETWVKRKSIGTYDIIAGQGSTSANNGLHIGFRDNNTFTLAFFSNDITTSTTYTDLGWHHWAATYDAVTDTQAVYFDGVLVQKRKSTGDYTGTGVFHIGNASWAGNNADVLLDDFRIWDHARTEFEVSSNINNCLSGLESGLLALYDFEDRNMILSDLSPNNYDGNLYPNMDPNTDWVDGVANCVNCNIEMSQLVTVAIESKGNYTQNLVSQSICEGSEIDFTIDGQGNIDGLDWQVSTDGGSTWSNITLGSGIYTGTMDSLHLSGVTTAEDGYMYRNIANKCGVYIDSTSAAELTVNTVTTSSGNLTECGSATINGVVYTSTQVVVDTLYSANSNGCDSIVTTNLTILNSSTFNQAISECGTATLNGNTYDSSQIVVDTLVSQASNGCDSIVITDLIILNSVASTQSFSDCDTVIINGNVYTSTQVVVDTLIGQAANGCDSIITLDIEVNNSSDTSISEDINFDETYLFGGVELNASGTYIDSLSNQDGCDSIVTLNLTVQPNGIDSEFSNINIYPNPVDNILNINSKINISSVKIFGIEGNELMVFVPNLNSLSINLNDLEVGVYFYEITLIDGAINRGKIMKE